MDYHRYRSDIILLGERRVIFARYLGEQTMFVQVL